MLKRRRFARSLALACATAAVATAPSSTLARPAGNPPGHPGSNGSRGAAAAAEPQTTVREIQTGGDQTLALMLSGSALVVALAGVGYSGRSRRRVHRVAQRQA